MARKIVEELADPAPVVAVVETDLRITVHVDVRRLLETADLASQSGAPSGPELEAYLRAAIARSLQDRREVMAVRVEWLEVPYLINVYDPDRRMRTEE